MVVKVKIVTFFIKILIFYSYILFLSVVTFPKLRIKNNLVFYWDD